MATFSSKLEPTALPIPTAASLPTTWQHTMSMLSDCVGLTFPGMMLEPGSFSGRASSPYPARGPEPRNRMSLEILYIDRAMVFRAPARAAWASLAASDSNLLGAVTNGSPVSAAISAAAISA